MDRNCLFRPSTFGVLDAQRAVLDVTRCEALNFTDAHATPGHKLQHQPVPDVRGPEYNLIHSFLVNYIPLDGLGSFEDFFNYSRIAGIGQGRQSGADTEIVKSREDRVSISLSCLLSLVKDIRKSKTSSWLILAKFRLPNRPENLEKKNSQVLMVFFFGVGPVVLKVEIDGLKNFHGVPPCFVDVRLILPLVNDTSDAEMMTGRVSWNRDIFYQMLHVGLSALNRKHIKHEPLTTF